jgi:TM2 domain-containing membrane protein YozV
MVKVKGFYPNVAKQIRGDENITGLGAAIGLKRHRLSYWKANHGRSTTGRAMTRAGNAAVLSLLIPGLGQFYNGFFLRGIFWLIITPGLWIGTGGLLGWICHVIAAITAYKKAQEIEDNDLDRMI